MFYQLTHRSEMKNIDQLLDIQSRYTKKLTCLCKDYKRKFAIYFKANSETVRFSLGMNRSGHTNLHIYRCC